MINELKTILVVDDNSSNLKLIASWLKTEYRLLLALPRNNFCWMLSLITRIVTANLRPNVIWSFSLPDYKTHFISNSAQKLHEIPQGDILRERKFWEHIVHPDDKGVAKQFSQRLVLSSELFHLA